MSRTTPIVVVGGGVAGLSLGILLRKHDAPVTVIESGTYPRHRVCGEFISGRGLSVLEKTNMVERLRARGARAATTVRFATQKIGAGPLNLPEPGFCVSRFTLDNELKAAFVEAGGELRERERWRGSFDKEGVVRATGRQTGPSAAGGGHIGLKAHIRGARMEADLEVHVVPGGYVGVCRLSDEVANVCGLFRRPDPGSELADRWRDWLLGPPESPLRRGLERGNFMDETFCAVAGLNLRPRKSARRDEWVVGDSITMISPVAGNGMSLAFESADLAARELVRYHRGETSWAGAKRAAARACDARFAQRLRWARAAHWIMLCPPLGGLMARCLTRAPSFWRALFARTR